MIFTRRFGALQARPEFPSLHVIDIADYEAQRKAEVQQRKAELQHRRAAKPTRRRRLFRGGRPVLHRHSHS